MKPHSSVLSISPVDPGTARILRASAPPSRSSVQPRNRIPSCPILEPHLTLPFYQPLRLTLGPHASCVRAPRPRVHQYNPETGSPRSRKSTPRPPWRSDFGLPHPSASNP